ncbi:MAG: SUMF1/EgtB/PvdO family nonheme iron enzyme [Sulfuritalea sp.]|nr:SUMF1/EgtB/PvdO family nonheme iron enzyme [Sulfuritalea sp.]
MQYRLRRWLVGSIGIFMLALAMPAQAARQALVIGNDSYAEAPKLKNARADARAVAQVLERAGFRVTMKLDSDEKGLKAAMREFKSRISGGDEVVFYFSGHGVQLGAANYLLPVDIHGDGEEQVKDESLALHRVLDDLQERRPRFSLAIVDACRDNPFAQAGRSIGGRGLAPVDPAKGQMVLFAASAGQRALDALSKSDPVPNGVFTRVLLAEMVKPGQPVDQVLRNVRAEVARLTRENQIPALYDQALGTFAFFAGTQVASLTAVATDPLAVELAFWNSVKDSRDAGEIKLYLEKYPRGQFAGLARGRVKSLVAAPPPGYAPPAPASAAVASPAGKVFRDCAECPELVVIPGGSYEMGSAADEAGRDSDEGPQHRVSVGTFALGKTEVTQGQWRALMGSNPSRFSSCGDGCPVENVSWDDAQAYVRRLSEKTGKRYRLPSEAEWEYACRAGGTQTYCGSDSVDRVAWYGGNSGSKTHPAAGKQANAFGLFDMSGNVWEWVEDCYHDSYSGAPSDGSAWTSGCKDVRRVLRGGSWSDDPKVARSADRIRSSRVFRFDSSGFRVARMLP